jgi:penicillin-binding protein 1A
VRESDGLLAGSGDKNAIWEPFKPGTVPQSTGPVLDGSETPAAGAGAQAPTPAAAEGTGGIY